MMELRNIKQGKRNKKSTEEVQTHKRKARQEYDMSKQRVKILIRESTKRVLEEFDELNHKSFRI